MDSLGRNITLPIYNADGTSFHGLELKKFTFDSIVMALGDKITGELYYPSNTLSVNQTEYVVYDGVKYYLINPPTIVKEGMKADNGTAKGMTKYSFTFYHPMFMLYNFPFTDVAVTSSEEKYKSQDKNFFWIGNLVDYVAKLNKNLTGTEWVVEIGSNVPVQDKNKLSEVLSFNDQKIADALKTGYDTWEIPYIIDIIASTDSRYAQGKRFLIRYGLPSQEILVENAQHQLVPYVFQMGKGIGLKNDSRTPKNNKIITRIAGYGSEDNVPFGYPQILWTGDQTWNYTINNSASAANSYPIYDGIVAGQRVRLIHHPFTRSHLMPTIYADTVNKKVNPYASGYDPTIEIKDYYDAVNDSSWTYPNQIISNAPSYEIHEFSDIKPELGEKFIVGAEAFNGDVSRKYMTVDDGVKQLNEYASETNIQVERLALHDIAGMVDSGTSGSGSGDDPQIYWFEYEVRSDAYFTIVTYASSNINFILEIHRNNEYPSAPWDDSMDDDGNYKQSYFRVTLPSLGFDLYACAAVTQEMKINMRSGACLGCSFPVEVDWDDYKKNFYDSDGKFAPYGQQRNFTKYPNSTSHEITVICKKELETFGTLMPNIYQQPAANDKFVILGISLPQSYITSAQTRLDNDMKQYMLDNNVHYFEYPLKFDEYFLANHTNILAQMKPNILVRFNFASEQHELYIKQLSVKYGEKVLPQYNITLTDDVEIVLSPIGRVTDEVSSLRVLFGSGGGSSEEYGNLKDLFLSKKDDDTAAGMIRFLRGLQVGEEFVTGLLGEGGIFRVDDDGTTYLECDKLYVRMRAYFDTVEVKKYLHSGGNRIASKAGIWCSRVEWLDSDGEITTVLSDAVKFRCYFRATSENGREITNDFVVNDLAFCKETNVDATSVDQHGYWRCVIAVSSSPTEDGEHWIDLSKTDCQTGSDVPIAQDDIVQLGHKTDTTRQGAIIEYVGGEDAPAYQIYQGINSYSLTGKNYVRFGYDSQSGGAQAYIGNPDGSTYLWYHYVTEGGQTFPRLDIKANVQFTSPITHQDTTIEDFAGAVTDSIEDLQEQIDGEIDTWFYEGTPTLNNAPANEWTTATEKERHLGDLYYDIGTGATGGFAYRFIKDENNVYQWQYLEDTAITEALAKAAEAYDLADHKRRVFYTTPTPPYDNGDLWVNAVWPASGASQGETYNDDILRCVTSKSATGTFSISDWTLASNYTDDSALVDFVTNTYAQDLENLETQIDGKAETWYQDSDPSAAWTDTDTKVAHVGDIWYDTSANGGKKTYIWRDRGEGQSNRFYWAEQAVPDDVFDEIDGKAAIYVEWGAWINQTTGENELKVKDLFIPSSDTTQGGVAYKANKVYRCTNASTPTFQEIHYTDDTTVDYIINTYGNILGISSPTAQNVGEALGFLRQVLGGSTSVDGGLVLTNLIAMKDAASTPNIWGGISGMYKTAEAGTTWKGHGTAAWYGGAMVDKECITPTPSESSWDTYKWARSLFRFDGSGYVANGNISWDKNGTPTIKGYVIDTETLKIGGNTVNLSDYVTLATDQTITGTKTFQNRIKIGDIYIGYDSTNDAIEVYKLSGSTHVAADFYATGGVSALGITSGGGGGGASLNQPLSGINSAGLSSPSSAGLGLVFNGSAWVYTNAASMSVYGLTVSSTLQAYNAIFGSTVSGAAFSATGGGFSVSGKDNTYVLLAGGGTKLLSEIGGGGAVNSITLGQGGTNYTPDASGIVTLPPYPSGTVTSVSYNNGTPITPISGVVGLGGLCVTVKVGSTDYGVSSSGVISLPAYPSTSGLVSSVVIGASGTPISPVNGVVTLPAYPSKTSDLTNDSGFITGYTDTKNTAGATDNVNTKLFLIGSTAQGANPQTYSNQSCYIGSDNCLYSGGSKVMTAASGYLPLSGGTMTGRLTTATLTNNNSSLYVYGPSTVLSYIQLYHSGGIPVADIGWFAGSDWGVPNTGGVYLFSHLTNCGFFVGADTLYYTDTSTNFDKYPMYGSHNANKSDVDWTCNNLYAQGAHINYGSNYNTLHIGSCSFSWGGNSGYPTLYSTPKTGGDRYTMIITPHIPFLKNGTRSYYGTSYGAIIRLEADSTDNATWWDIGLPTADTFAIKRQSTTVLSISNAGALTASSVAVTGGTSSQFLKADGSVDGTSYATTDTKNTAGNADVYASSGAPILYLVGTASYGGSGSYAQSSVNRACYVGSDNCLYSNGDKVMTAGSYLPLAGGTMTGDLKFDGTKNLSHNGAWDSGIVAGADGHNKVVLSYLGAITNGATIGGHNSNLTAWATLNVCGTDIIFRINETEKCRVHTNGYFGIATTSPLYPLDVAGAVHCDLVRSGGLIITTGSGLTGGAVIPQVTIGQTSLNTSYTLLVDGSCRINNLSVGSETTVQSTSCATLETHSSRGVYVKTGTAPNYVDGSWSNASDMRLKDIVSNIGGSVDDIANAPIFNFRWKAGGNQVMVGTSAQYWQNVLPNTVTQAFNGYLYMDYSAAAIAAAVITARKVQEHDARIQILERENEALRHEIQILKAL